MQIRQSGSPGEDRRSRQAPRWLDNDFHALGEEAHRLNQLGICGGDNAFNKALNYWES
jgi:hypothetical protein